MKKITIEASKVWAYYEENKLRLKKMMHEIASNENYGTSVYITDSNGSPCIIVTADSVQVFEHTIANKEDCEKAVEKVFDIYLTYKALEALAEDDNDIPPAVQDLDTVIATSEEDLDNAVIDFVNVAIEGDFTKHKDFRKICEDVKDHFLEYLARKHNMSSMIYRPMFLEYEDGVEEYEEYPYENMEFEDENNPIYK